MTECPACGYDITPLPARHAEGLKAWTEKLVNLALQGHTFEETMAEIGPPPGKTVCARCRSVHVEEGVALGFVKPSAEAALASLREAAMRSMSECQYECNAEVYCGRCKHLVRAMAEEGS